MEKDAKAIETADDMPVLTLAVWADEKPVSIPADNEKPAVPTLAILEDDNEKPVSIHDDNEKPVPTLAVPEDDNEKPVPTLVVPEDDNEKPVPTLDVPEDDNEKPVPTLAVPEDDEKPAPTPAATIKKRGFLSFLRAAFLMARRRMSGKPTMHTEAVQFGGGELWRALVCGMRPLHLQPMDDFPPTPPPVKAESPNNVLSPPPLPLEKSDDMSRYASAEDLQALDEKEDKNGEIEGTADAGSSEIDMRAEEFISRFYEQIKLQRLESVARASEESAC